MSDFRLPSADDGGQVPARPPDELRLDGSGDGTSNRPGGDGPQPPEPVPADVLIPPPPPAPASPPTPASAPGEDGSLRNRIAAATRDRDAGWTVPPSYPALGVTPPGEDWRTILSDDLFTQLYLDWNQAASVADDVVRRRGDQLRKFWEGLAGLYRSGTPDTRAKIKGAYQADDVALDGYARRAEAAADALATAEKRTALVGALEGGFQTRTLARLEDFLLGDRVLAGAESARLLEQAEADGWTRAAAAAFLLDELGRLGFRNEAGGAPGDVTGKPEEVILSSSWLSDSGSPPPEKVIGRDLDTAMLSGSLVAAQIRALLDIADQAGVDRESAAEFIAERLGVFRGEWLPAPGQVLAEGPLAEALSRVDWLSPEKHGEAFRHHGSQKIHAPDNALAPPAGPPSAPVERARTPSSKRRLVIGAVAAAPAIALAALLFRGDIDAFGSTAGERTQVVTESLSVRRAPTGSSGPVSPPVPPGGAAGVGIPLDDVPDPRPDEDGNTGVQPDPVRPDPSQPDERRTDVLAPPAPRPDPARLYNAREVDRAATAGTSPRASSPPGGYSGMVWVDVVVSSSGRVESAECRTGPPRSTCAEAEQRASGVRFDPAQVDGYDVRSRSEVAVVFTARDPDPEPPPPPPQCPPDDIARQITLASQIGTETDPDRKARLEAELEGIQRRCR